MEDHDWDECGPEIADLFKGDDVKRASISDAWYCDLDSDEQMLVHEYVCENKRGPDALEAARRYEQYAAKRERETREKLAKRKAEQEKHQNVSVARESLAQNEEYQRFRNLIAEHTAYTASTATSAGDIRYKTENAW